MTEERPLTLDDCHQFVSEKIFRMTPVDYGARYPKWPGAVGIEVEMLAVENDASGALSSVPIYPQSSHETAQSVLLEKLAEAEGWKPDRWKMPDGEERLMAVVLDKGDRLTFEPGGQLEFSSVPYPCLDDALTRFEEVRSKLANHLKASGVSLIQLGANPWETVDEVGLRMPKPRYGAMDRYFTQLSPFGRRMMRQTCTTQVNLDFGDSETLLAQRFWGAQLVAPIVTAAFAHSPWIDGRAANFRTMRAHIWQGVDPTRTGFPELAEVSTKQTKDSCVRSYVDYILKAQVCFIESDGFRVPSTPVSFGTWMEKGVGDYRPTHHDLDTHASLLFPEVRPRGFMELRSVDCQPVEWQGIPAAVYCGLFYDSQALQETLDLLGDKTDSLSDLWKRSPMGLEDEELASLAQRLFRLAWEGFRRLPSCFRARGADQHLEHFIEAYTEKGRTPADDILDLLSDNGGSFDWNLIKDLESRRQQLIS